MSRNAAPPVRTETENYWTLSDLAALITLLKYLADLNYKHSNRLSLLSGVAESVRLA